MPERWEMLIECERSVQAQTYDYWEHLVLVDYEQAGCAVTMNRLAEAAQGEWLLPLADDDLLLPGALSALLTGVDQADIVYASPLVTGNEDRWWFFQAPPAIPSFALIRAEVWRQLGGYNEGLTREEDRDLWTKAIAAGVPFERVDEPCWVYRQHAGNKSFQVAA